MTTKAQTCCRSIRVTLALLTLLGLTITPVHAEQVVEWRQVPMSIVLTVGEERVLAFPDHVEVGVPANLTSALRTQSTGGTVLWFARLPFQTERLQVRLLTTGHVMLFDVTAVEACPSGEANNEPLRVVFPDALAAADRPNANERTMTPVTLTRFAAQQLYAPVRVVRDIAGVRRAPMGVPESIALYRHDRIAAQPLASWQGGGYFVTAVKLTNASDRRLILDPRALRGHFVTASFQHNSVGPKGSPAETTVVYLVTDRPFATAILTALPPDDAAFEH